MSIEKAKKGFAAARAEFGAAVALAGMPLKEARQCIIAAHEVLSKLADAATTAGELEPLTDAMEALTAELTAVVNAELKNSEAKYEPITAQIKAATAALKDAKKRAEQLAAQLAIATELLGSFTKLLTAFK